MSKHGEGHPIASFFLAVSAKYRSTNPIGPFNSNPGKAFMKMNFIGEFKNKLINHNNLCYF